MSTINDLLNARDEIEAIGIIRENTPEEFRDIPDLAWLTIAAALVEYYTSCTRKQIGLVEQIRKGVTQ